MTERDAPMDFEEYWRTLKSSGWLAAYSDERVEDLRRRVQDCFNRGVPELTVYALDSGELDPEWILNDDYGETLLQ